jgi:threonine/homoserine/homoserine lactone efflux protein
LAGLAVGLSIAAPVGPIGLLCIQRTLARGRTSGLLTGLGAATADAVFGSIAAFGVTAVSTILVSQQLWVRLVGGAFLIYLGVRICATAPGESSAQAGNRSLARDYASTLALTLTNPVTIISFAAVFTGLGLAGGNGDYTEAAVLVSGVFSGSVLWWVLLSTSVGAVRHRIDSGNLRWINRFSGAIITVFGLATLLSLLL